MKKILLLITLLISISSMAQGQGDLTIYSNTGAKFYVILNGIRQNQNPETNVKVTGLNNNWYSCKIISEDKSFEIEKNVGVKFDTLITYRITEKKGKYKLRFFSETSLGTASSVSADQTVIVYHTSETPTTVIETTPTETTNTTINTSTTTTSTNGSNTQQPATSEGINGSESINMNVNISENGMNANVNITGTGTTSEQNGISTSTTTTSSSTGVNGSTYFEESTSASGNGTTTTTYYEETSSTSSTSTDNNNVQNNNIDHNNCYTSDADVKNMQTQIKNENFEDDQLRVANLAAKNKCMSVAQIKVIANTFTFDDNKLSFIKTAYNNCTDQSNYYQLLEVLTFSEDKETLETFINSKK